MTPLAFGKYAAITFGLLWLPIVHGCGPDPAPTPAERIQNAGENVAQLLAQVREATDQSEYAKGLRLADSLMHVAPGLPESHYERGLILIRLRRMEAADEALQAAVELDPYHRGAWYQRGHVAFEQRRYPDAIRLYRRQREVIEASPASLKEYYRWVDRTAIPQTWVQIGRAYELEQQTDSARWAYEKVLEIDSTHAQAHAWLSALYDEEGDVEQALAHIRRAWRYDTDNPEHAYRFGTLLYESGAFDEALPLLERAVSMQPWNAGAHYNLGRTLMALGRARDGRQHMEMTDRLQDLDQAIEYARAAIAKFPDDPARWQELADLLGRAGRSTEQQDTHQIIRALAHDPGKKMNPSER